jgi:hypothetical protein
MEDGQLIYFKHTVYADFVTSLWCLGGKENTRS